MISSVIIIQIKSTVNRAVSNKKKTNNKQKNELLIPESQRDFFCFAPLSLWNKSELSKNGQFMKVEMILAIDYTT